VYVTWLTGGNTVILIDSPAVSPWQFKNLGGENDWVEQSDFLWYYRWLQAIQDVDPDIVEIGNSHNLGQVFFSD
jgi:hypothetical protein